MRFPARGEKAALDAGAWRCTSFGHRHHPPIYACDDCGLLFQWPMPSAEALEEAYAGVVDPLYMAERENRILTFRKVIRALGPAGGRRLLGPRWPWLMDMHLVYFDRPTISALLEEAGFRVREIRTYSHTVSAGYLLRKLGASFPALSPVARALARVVPTSWPIPVNLGDNMLVSAERA